ncbi:MAG: DUF924 family protein [Pseudomonadota bacterium]
MRACVRTPPVSSDRTPEHARDESAGEILSFWFEESKPAQWFRRDPVFDETIRSRFGTLYEKACAGALDHWLEAPEPALALIILLDQFSRNIHRDGAEAFDHDDKALAYADRAIEAGHDKEAPPAHRAFFYMPFMHAEDLTQQERCVALFTERLPGSDNIRHAEEHRDIIRRFGRFPHRNATLERSSTSEEIAFLEGGGFNPTGSKKSKQ